MREGIVGFRAPATGPATLLARLRRETRPVRRQPRAVPALRGVRTAFPAALLGGELLGLLGKRVRELLLEPAPAPDDEAGLRALSRRLALRGGAERPPGLPVAAPPGTEPARRPVSPLPGEAARPGALAPSRPGELARATPGRVPADDAARDRRAPSGAALVEERLRSYRRTLVLEPRRAGLVARAAAGDGARLPATAGEQAASSPRAPMTDAEIARELRAFVGDQASAPEIAPGGAPSGDGGLDGGGALRPLASIPAAVHAAAPTRRPPPSAVPAHTLGPDFGATAASRAAVRRALADELAAIVREQALRHGIDLP